RPDGHHAFAIEPASDPLIRIRFVDHVALLNAVVATLVLPSLIRSGMASRDDAYPDRLISELFQRVHDMQERSFRLAHRDPSFLGPIVNEVVPRDCKRIVKRELRSLERDVVLAKVDSCLGFIPGKFTLKSRHCASWMAT